MVISEGDVVMVGFGIEICSIYLLYYCGTNKRWLQLNFIKLSYNYCLYQVCSVSVCESVGRWWEISNK